MIKKVSLLWFLMVLIALQGCASKQEIPVSPNKPYSDSYPAKVAARIKANLVFTEKIENNEQRTLVKVRTDRSGAILESQLLKSSGSRAWDEAVLRAVRKTEKIPLDIDGRVPALLELVFQPK
jgi:colicin import membrane protein